MNTQAQKEGGRKRAGFTLIETIAVIVIIGVLAAVVTAGFQRTHAEVAAEAGVLRARLGFAQSLALANNHVQWSLLVNGNGYTLLCDGVPACVPWPDSGSAQHSLQNPVQVVGGTGVHLLNEYGAPDDPVQITLSDGEVSRSVTMYAFTGFIP
jgi:prepilin-type N-terminal cleavage/methylation domain-containing protein